MLGIYSLEKQSLYGAQDKNYMFSFGRKMENACVLGIQVIILQYLFCRLNYKLTLLSSDQMGHTFHTSTWYKSLSCRFGKDVIVSLYYYCCQERVKVTILPFALSALSPECLHHCCNPFLPAYGWQYVLHSIIEISVAILVT